MANHILLHHTHAYTHISIRRTHSQYERPSVEQLMHIVWITHLLDIPLSHGFS